MKKEEKTIERIHEGKFKTLEKDHMNSLYGGRLNNFAYTMDTLTYKPSGDSSNDGNDDFDGE